MGINPKVLSYHALTIVSDQLLISEESSIVFLVHLKHLGKASTIIDVTECDDDQQIENGSTGCPWLSARKIDMKTLSFMFFILTVAAPVMAAPPEVKPTLAICMAELKEWSQQKTEILTNDQIFERLHTMVACADEAHHHHFSDKKTLAYLKEFYRELDEMSDRMFDFIKKHDLKEQFDEEENGVGSGQTASKEN